MRAAFGTARTTGGGLCVASFAGPAAPARVAPSPLLTSAPAATPAPGGAPPARRSPLRVVRRRPVPAAATAAAAPAPPTMAAVEPPSSAVTARTIVDLVAHGTLCTVGEDGVPLGTYASYVLDAAGQPLLRLRADAVHTANLARSSRCSLFVQAPDRPARLLARCTLVGVAARLDTDEANAAAEAHSALHGGSGAGVDAPRADDVYFRLAVESVFHVAGLGGSAAAESIGGEAYAAAVPDGLRQCAAALVGEYNATRPAEVARIAALAAGCALDDLAAAELLWVDEAGAFAWLARDGEAECGGAGGSGGGCGEIVRVSFERRVLDDRDARSCLTMLSQVAWELERGYVPVMPTVPDPVA